MGRAGHVSLLCLAHPSARTCVHVDVQQRGRGVVLKHNIIAAFSLRGPVSYNQLFAVPGKLIVVLKHNIIAAFWLRGPVSCNQLFAVPRVQQSR
ncbi:hypothetical protein NDU88_001010 [Pleurodeles waltl]|uniref:Secreted protein n=1 Tax=Pleurodeles waltl TaxID=8319 RepID=A0AAV7SZ22_PLEWA|nr:hypothetical protein NDU88_001010 [Pleurodeles waltl]